MPDEPYIFKGEDGDYKFQADGWEMVRGKKKCAGLGRYVVQGGRKSNVVLVPTENTLYTWGYAVRPGLTIEKGDEIFL